MTPPAAAAAAPRTRARTAPRKPPPRRKSGPARPPARGRGAAAVAAPPPLALRLGGAVHGIAEHRFLDRIIHGRAWIAIVAVGLIGIVFMQVSMLRMNAGIGAGVERAATLERQNSAMRAMISELSSGERIAAEAAKLGLVLAPGTPRFLDAREADAGKALASITRPGEGIIPSPQSIAAAEAALTSAPATVPTLDETGVVPEAPSTAPPAPETQSTATATTDPAATTPSTATTATEPTTTSTALTTQSPPADGTGGAGAPGAAG